MAAEALQSAPTVYEELLQLQKENNILKTEIEYWKAQHKRATERETALKKELQDQRARVRYLNRQLYERKTERSKTKRETQHDDHPSKKRKRGQQPNNPSPTYRDQTHLPSHEEIYDLPKERQILFDMRSSL